MNNSSDESDETMTSSQSKSKKRKNDHGSLKTGRFIIAKGGEICVLMRQMKLNAFHCWKNHSNY